MFDSVQHEWMNAILSTCFDKFGKISLLRHQTQVLERVQQSHAQVLLTGTQVPEILRSTGTPDTLFHVEQGQIRPD